MQLTLSYIGRTSRRFSMRIREHLPAWLGKGETRSISSAILARMVDSGHRVDPNEAYRVIYKVPSSYSKLLGQRLLATAEAVAIRLRKPILCAQKNHVRAPRLQWSKVDQRCNSPRPSALTPPLTLTAFTPSPPPTFPHPACVLRRTFIDSYNR
ncbi:hypothetical protein SprV_0100430700 [Sparganum proliferum]